MAHRKTVKDFQFQQRIGEGSYSQVFKAIDLSTHKQFAIKVLSKKHIVKEKKIKYVNIEKNTLNRLGKHPGIVTLHYTFQDENSLYFVIDFAQFGELLTIIRKYGSLSELVSKFYMTQLIDAVDFMHSKGVIHRDLKPENILVNSDMKIMLTDFGAAKILEDPSVAPTTNTNSSTTVPSSSNQSSNASTPVNNSSTAGAIDETFQDDKGSFVGTAEYVPPELLKFNKTGYESDVWALGCILYQFIVGVPPFKGTTEYLTFEKIVSGTYEWPNYFVPDQIKKLVKQLLNPSYERRIDMEGIKSSEWFKNVNWEDKYSIWNSKPPKLDSYKPIIEQSLHQQNVTNNYQKKVIKKLPASTVKKQMLNNTINQIRSDRDGNFMYNMNSNGNSSKRIQPPTPQQQPTPPPQMPYNSPTSSPQRSPHSHHQQQQQYNQPPMMRQAPPKMSPLQSHAQINNAHSQVSTTSSSTPTSINGNGLQIQSSNGFVNNEPVAPPPTRNGITNGINQLNLKPPMIAKSKQQTGPPTSTPSQQHIATLQQPPKIQTKQISSSPSSSNQSPVSPITTPLSANAINNKTLPPITRPMPSLTAKPSTPTTISRPAFATSQSSIVKPQKVSSSTINQLQSPSLILPKRSSSEKNVSQSTVSTSTSTTATSSTTPAISSAPTSTAPSTSNSRSTSSNTIMKSSTQTSKPISVPPKILPPKLAPPQLKKTSSSSNSSPTSKSSAQLKKSSSSSPKIPPQQSFRSSPKMIPKNSLPKVPTSSNFKSSSAPTSPNKLYPQLPTSITSYLSSKESILKADYITISDLVYSDLLTFDPSSKLSNLSSTTPSLDDFLINEIIISNTDTLEKGKKRILLLITDLGNLILLNIKAIDDITGIYLKVDLTEKSFAMYDYEFSEYRQSGYLILEVLKKDKLVFLSPLEKSIQKDIEDLSKYRIGVQSGWIEALLKAKELLSNQVRSGESSPSSAGQSSSQQQQPHQSVPQQRVSSSNSVVTHKKKPTTGGKTPSKAELKREMNKKFAGGAAAAAFKASK